VRLLIEFAFRRSGTIMSLTEAKCQSPQLPENCKGINRRLHLLIAKIFA
jgi:hypothetical protein